MKRQWTKWLGIILAGSMLVGCGSQPGGAEPLTAGSETAGSETAGSGTAGSETAGSGTTGSGTTGSGTAQTQAGDGGTEPQQMQTAEGQGWNREDDGSYEALQQFSQRLMLENMEEVNPLLSPVSAYLALGMVGMGARGETGQEFQDLLGGNMPAVSRSLMERYPQEQEGMVLTIANSVWMDQQVTPDVQWIADMEGIFRGEGYRGVLSSQEIMDQINAWCSEKTRGLIPQMLEEPLNSDASLTVLDAIYFKGDWIVPFDALDTVQRPFTKEDGTELQVDTMSMCEQSQRYLHSELGEGVLLPYQGGEFAYVAILPGEGIQVRELYRQLTPQALAELLESEKRELCNLRLPKYEVRFDGSMADFSGLVQKDSMHISLVKQKAVFRVDEKGTEAAAVTMVVMDRLADLEAPESRDLYFDRPFVYMILDLETQVPLFVGIMDDPG